jgi:hypothetical protein
MQQQLQYSLGRAWQNEEIKVLLFSKTPVSITLKAFPQR